MEPCRKTTSNVLELLESTTKKTETSQDTSLNDDNEAKDFKQRIKTYKPSLWALKPTSLSPLTCARFGWMCRSKDTLICSSCSEILVVKLENSITMPQSYNESVLKYEEALIHGHKKLCPWRFNPVKEAMFTLQWTDAQSALAEVLSCLENLLNIESDVSENISCSSLGDSLECLVKLCQSNGSQFIKDFNFSSVEKCLVLALNGWTAVRPTTSPSKPSTKRNAILHCNWCLRDIGLWNYYPQTRLAGLKHIQEVEEECSQVYTVHVEHKESQSADVGTEQSSVKEAASNTASLEHHSAESVEKDGTEPSEADSSTDKVEQGVSQLQVETDDHEQSVVLESVDVSGKSSQSESMDNIMTQSASVSNRYDMESSSTDESSQSTGDVSLPISGSGIPKLSTSCLLSASTWSVASVAGSETPRDPAELDHDMMDEAEARAALLPPPAIPPEPIEPLTVDWLALKCATREKGSGAASSERDWSVMTNVSDQSLADSERHLLMQQTSVCASESDVPMETEEQVEVLPKTSSAESGSRLHSIVENIIQYRNQKEHDQSDSTLLSVSGDLDASPGRHDITPPSSSTPMTQSGPLKRSHLGLQAACSPVMGLAADKLHWNWCPWMMNSPDGSPAWQLANCLLKLVPSEDQDGKLSGRGNSSSTGRKSFEESFLTVSRIMSEAQVKRPRTSPQ